MSEGRGRGKKPSRPKRYPCPWCFNLFDRPCSLKQHVFIHTGEKPHKCHLCGNGFATKSNLYRHERKCARPGSTAGPSGPSVSLREQPNSRQDPLPDIERTLSSQPTVLPSPAYISTTENQGWRIFPRETYVSHISQNKRRGPQNMLASLPSSPTHSPTELSHSYTLQIVKSTRPSSASSLSYGYDLQAGSRSTVTSTPISRSTSPSITPWWDVYQPHTAQEPQVWGSNDVLVNNDNQTPHHLVHSVIPSQHYPFISRDDREPHAGFPGHSLSSQGSLPVATSPAAPRPFSYNVVDPSPSSYSFVRGEQERHPSTLEIDGPYPNGVVFDSAGHYPSHSMTSIG